MLEKHPDDDATNEYIRTEANHYIYQRAYAPRAVLDAALGATTVIGLTFAGVDIVLGRDGRCYVLETNTAPGIGQLTAKRIACAIRTKAGL
jgi:glutathione synthase/RimK-type ligase-like ATP-grasp enzyme